MKIPNKIKVAGHLYRIKYDDKRLSKENIVAEVNHDKNEIALCEYYHTTKRAKSEIEESLLHEILHIIDTNYNDHSLKEKQVKRLAIGLHQVLKDNFKF